MERGKQIVWRIQNAKQIEGRAEPACRVRARKSEAQRPEEKADSGEEDRDRNPARVQAQFGFVREKKRRQDKKEVDRQIRQNQGRHEGDGTFPFEIENAHIAPVRRNPETTAVNDQEEKRKSGRDNQRPPEQDLPFHLGARRAIETVNIPQRS